MYSRKKRVNCIYQTTSSFDSIFFSNRALQKTCSLLFRTWATYQGGLNKVYYLLKAEFHNWNAWHEKWIRRKCIWIQYYLWFDSNWSCFLIFLCLFVCLFVCFVFDWLILSLHRPSIYSAQISLPEPLEGKELLARSLYPWRSFLERWGKNNS